MAASHTQGAHNYEGALNARGQRSNSKLYRGVSRAITISPERLTSLLNAAKRKKP
jgi:hypothetical protein